METIFQNLLRHPNVISMEITKIIRRRIGKGY